MPTLEQEVKALKDRIRLLESIVIEKKPYCPEWDAVIRAIENRDFGPYKAFIAAGGKIPGEEREG